MTTTLQTMAQNAKLASYTLASLDSEVKNRALLKIAEKIEENKEKIFEENKKDLAAADRKSTR